MSSYHIVCRSRDRTPGGSTCDYSLILPGVNPSPSGYHCTARVAALSDIDESVEMQLSWGVVNSLESIAQSGPRNSSSCTAVLSCASTVPGVGNLLVNPSQQLSVRVVEEVGGALHAETKEHTLYLTLTPVETRKCGC